MDYWLPWLGTVSDRWRQVRINTCGGGVKESSGALTWFARWCTLTRAGPPAGLPRVEERRARHMADVAYVVLTIAIFALLALMLRGLEKLG